LEGNDNDATHNTALAQIILLRKTETPLSFEESVLLAFNNELDEITFESNIPYGENIYDTLGPNNEYGINREEVLAIYFYTLEWTPKSLNLYSRLNRDLSSSERDNSIPKWKHYLHYLLGGLRKLPKWVVKQDLYRGVCLNLVKAYPQKYCKGGIITWYGFTSTTTNLEKVKSFLGDNDGTIFSINDCISGRSIRIFSGLPSEDEILIPAGSRFQIVSIVSFGKITMIQLKQIPTLEKLLKME